MAADPLILTAKNGNGDLDQLPGSGRPPRARARYIQQQHEMPHPEESKSRACRIPQKLCLSRLKSRSGTRSTGPRGCKAEETCAEACSQTEREMPAC